MANAKTDSNSIKTMIGTLSSDGATPINIVVNATSHGIDVEDNTTGSDLSGNVASRDSNYQPVLMGVSSADGVTPTAIYVNSSGQLLIDSA